MKPWQDPEPAADLNPYMDQVARTLIQRPAAPSPPSPGKAEAQEFFEQAGILQDVDAKLRDLGQALTAEADELEREKGALHRACVRHLTRAVVREQRAKAWIAAAACAWFGLAAVAILGALGFATLGKTGALNALFLAGALCVASSGYLLWLADLRRCRA